MKKSTCCPQNMLRTLVLGALLGLASTIAHAADRDSSNASVPCPVSNGTLPNPILCRCGISQNRSCTARAGTFCFADHALCTTRPNMRRRPPAIVFEVGSCAESNGRSLINSSAECDAAAVELDFADSKSATIQNHDTAAACLVTTSDKKVYFNANPAATGHCTLYIACVCAADVAPLCSSQNGLSPHNNVSDPMCADTKRAHG